MCASVGLLIRLPAMQAVECLSCCCHQGSALNLWTESAEVSRRHSALHAAGPEQQLRDTRVAQTVNTTRAAASLIVVSSPRQH